MDDADPPQRSSGTPWAGRTPPVCPYCNAPIDPQKLVFPGHCGELHCRVAYGRDRAREARVAEAHKQARREAHWAMGRVRLVEEGHLAAQAMRMGRHPREVPHISVPFQEQPLVPVTDDDRARFWGHVDRLIEVEFEDPPPEEPEEKTNPNPEYPAVAAACATCQGACCLNGEKNFAYISWKTIQYLRWAIPECTPDDIRALYADHMPETHADGGCLFQGAEGCTLPRDRRAFICNWFHCWAVRRMKEDHGTAPDYEVLVAALDDDGRTLCKVGRYEPAPDATD